MAANDIPILQKISDFYKGYYQYAANFPKKDRFGIGQKCENSLLFFMEHIIRASKSNKENKKTILYEASIQLDMLKIFIRLMKELRILDMNIRHLTVAVSLRTQASLAQYLLGLASQCNGV